MNAFLFLIALYLAAGTAIAVIVHRARSAQAEYYIASGTLSGALSAGTYAATTYSAFMMVGLVGLSYQHGVGALIFEMAYLVSTILLLTFYGPRIWRLGRDKGYVSPMELFTGRYGNASGALGAVISFAALIPYTSSQVIGSALIFQRFGGFDFVTGVAIASVTIALWAFIGGLRGVALTDSIQGVFMVGVAIAGGAWVAKRFGGFELQSFPNRFWTPALFANFTIPWLFFALTNPQVLQRLFILKDRTALRRMIIFFGIFGVLYTFLVTFIGFSARFGTERGIFGAVSDRDKIILEIIGLMRYRLALPLALSIVFASVTTANSIILTLSSMVVRDLFGERRKVWVGRVLILALTLLVFAFAMTRPNYIVELSVASSSILLCFVPLLFGLFHWKRGGKYTGFITLAVGAGSALLFRLAKLPLSSAYSLAAGFAVFFAVGFIEGRPKKVFS
jgi:solute:Na+ symporter, SSS family